MWPRVYDTAMAETPQITFRANKAEREQIRRVSASLGMNRTDTIKHLVEKADKKLNKK